MKIKRKTVFRIIRVLLYCSGVFFLLLNIFAFTTLPYYARYWLGTHQGCVKNEPEVIVLLGGAGIPSEDGLIRTYYTALLGNKYSEASIIIALPGDTTDSLSSPVLLRNELELRGIKTNRISFENTGHNTRQQALQIAESNRSQLLGKKVALVTAPENMFRSILCFKKVGFTQVEGLPTIEFSIDEKDLFFNDKDLKGNKFVPPIGQNKQFRYQFWNHLKYEIFVIREGFALGYYKLRSWI